jgi:hypothetical protein
MWRHNVIAFVVAVAVIFALGLLANAADPFRRIDVSPELSIAIVVATFVFLGVGAFLGFNGGFWTRTILATLAPAIACLMWSLMSPDDGYRWVSTLLGALLAAASFLGCVFIGGPIFLWRQHQRERHLTLQSRTDAR